MIYEKKADDGWYLNFDKYYTDHAPSYNPLPHYHSSYEIYVCESGSYPVYINGQRRDITEGEIAFVDRFTPHASGRLERCGEFGCYLLVISSAYLGESSWLDSETLPDFTEKHDGYERIIELLRWGYAEKERMTREMANGFITLLLGVLRDYCDTRPRGNDKVTRLIVEIMKYISTYYSEDITLESLAHRFGYEKTYLSRLFNQALGMNLREYLNRCRISAAVNMRRDRPDMPIYKIAEACGYESLNTFYRAYNSYSSSVESK